MNFLKNSENYSKLAAEALAAWKDIYSESTFEKKDLFSTHIEGLSKDLLELSKKGEDEPTTLLVKTIQEYLGEIKGDFKKAVKGVNNATSVKTLKDSLNGMLPTFGKIR